MLNDGFVKLLVCPESKQSLTLAEPAVLASINQQVLAKTLKNRLGEAIVEPLDALLVREDGCFGYPVRADIPVMLVDEAIPLVGQPA